jgi:hypothetical protein
VEEAWKRIMVVRAPSPSTGHVVFERGTGKELIEIADPEDAAAVATLQPFERRK